MPKQIGDKHYRRPDHCWIRGENFLGVDESSGSLLVERKDVFGNEFWAEYDGPGDPFSLLIEEFGLVAAGKVTKILITEPREIVTDTLGKEDA